MATNKYVYLFNEYDEVMGELDDDWDAVRGLLGGKGANLLDATRLGIPVPRWAATTTWPLANSFLRVSGNRN